MIHRNEFRAMGCKMLALVDSESSPGILQDVPAWFEEWEQTFSRFRSDSELVQLNMDAGRPVQVSQTLWDVFQLSVSAERMTQGLVNPLILDALLNAGYDETFEGVLSNPHRIFPDLEADVPSLGSVIADETHRTISLPKGARLDFGGVAKGWAAHQAAERLKEAGPALVNAGGDISVSGPRLDGESWHIGVADPFQPDTHIDFLYVERGGVATSGRDYHRWSRDRIPQHHIIDPRTGLPAETDILTATVVAPTAMEAEAMAKAVLISGSQAGLAWLDANDDLAGLLILESGERLYSRNFWKYKECL